MVSHSIYNNIFFLIGMSRQIGWIMEIVNIEINSYYWVWKRSAEHGLTLVNFYFQQCVVVACVDTENTGKTNDKPHSKITFDLIDIRDAIVFDLFRFFSTFRDADLRTDRPSSVSLYCRLHGGRTAQNQSGSWCHRPGYTEMFYRWAVLLKESFFCTM